MTDDAKQTAWDRYREQLEALEVDPYSPDVPEDDPRHAQVQSIVAEYRGVPLPLFSLSESWEGTPPLFTIASLDDVARWLRDEWSNVTATRMGSEDGFYQAKYRANQTIRNAHRILDALNVEDRPERQPPAENLEECEQQFHRLERWFQEKHASGWKPPKAATHAAKPRATAKLRRDAVPDDEAEFLAKRFLKQNPDATSREVAEEIGIALGRVSSLPSWKRIVAERKASKKPSEKSARSLTPEMLASIGKEVDLAADIMRREAVWQWLVENADNQRRAELHGMSEEQQQALVQVTLDQFKDELPPELAGLD